MTTDAPGPGQPWDAEGATPPGAEPPPQADPQGIEAPPAATLPSAPAPALAPEAPPAPPAAEPPVPPAPAPGGIYPAGVYPAGTTVLGEPVAPIATSPEPKKRGGLVAAVIAAVVVFGGLVLKFGLPILVGTAASGLLGGVFGGPFEKLPQDRQDALEKRVETALGDSIKDLDETQASARINALLSAGLPRLADEDLTDKIHLTVTILNTADAPTCARLARANATGSADPDAVSTAVGTLDAASIERWFDINITAVEAEVAGTPPVRTVDPDEATRVFTAAAATFTDAQRQNVNGLYNGGEVTDAEACDAIRAVYQSIETLPPADLALAALYDVSP